VRRSERGMHRAVVQAKNDQVKEDEMGRACKPERKRPLEDQDVGGWIILKWILER
jgi:hypothetical protein